MLKKYSGFVSLIPILDFDKRCASLYPVRFVQQEPSMQFITSGLWVWAVIFVLSLLKLWKIYTTKDNSPSGSGEDLSFLGDIFWGFIAVWAAPISGILLLIAIFAK